MTGLEHNNHSYSTLVAIELDEIESDLKVMLEKAGYPTEVSQYIAVLSPEYTNKILTPNAKLSGDEKAIKLVLEKYGSKLPFISTNMPFELWTASRALIMSKKIRETLKNTEVSIDFGLIIYEVLQFCSFLADINLKLQLPALKRAQDGVDRVEAANQAKQVMYGSRDNDIRSMAENLKKDFPHIKSKSQIAKKIEDKFQWDQYPELPRIKADRIRHII